MDVTSNPSAVFAKSKKPLSEKKKAALAIAQQRGVVAIKAKAAVRRKTELQIGKAVKKIQLAQAEEVARKMMLPAVGQNFIYKIITHKDAKGRVERREHVLLESSYEIAHALDCLANDGGKDEDDEDLFYYVTVKEPDYRAGEAILNRAIGKTADKAELTVKTFSLVALARERATLPPHMPNLLPTPTAAVVLDAPAEEQNRPT